MSRAAAVLLTAAVAFGYEPRHGVVFHDPKTFAGWPANGGLWVYDGGKEAVVAFTTGPFRLRGGHNVVPPYTNVVARTRDGGATWTREDPPGFYQPGDRPAALTSPIPFDHPDLALRFVGTGYHAAELPAGGVCYSTDRGKTWKSAALPPLVRDGRTELTLRTGFRVLGPRDCLVFGSARFPGKSGTDRAFAAKLTDGGRAGTLLGWFDAPESTERTMMPATVGGDRLFAAVRVRKADADANRIDGYASTDGGATWARTGTVGETGAANGNPPALIRLRDGRLVCAYGDRTRHKLFARLSGDNGKTWGAEVVLRADPEPDALGDVDLGYPRLFERPDGAVVCVYYWASKDRPTHHIAATTWPPPKR